MSAPNAVGHSSSSSSSSQQVDPAVDKLVRETKSLKAKIDVLESENRALKKSLYDLSYIYSSQLDASRRHQQYQTNANPTSVATTTVPGDDTKVSAGMTGVISDNTNSLSSGVGAGASYDMLSAVGQLITDMSLSKQPGQGADSAASSSAGSSDVNPRAGADPQFKNTADILKVEDEGVRRLNMGNIVSRQDGSSKSDGRQFYLKNDLKGHQGAIYAVQYSPNGKFLATGSFDKTVRIWDGTSNQTELFVLKGHGLNISDLAWSYNSTLLLSAAYDKTCKLWDVETGKLMDSFEGDGFVQCVRFHPQGNRDFYNYAFITLHPVKMMQLGDLFLIETRNLDNHIFFSGTTRNILSMVDNRKDSNPSSGSAMNIKNDGMVNSIYVYHDGLTVISGDSSGYIKTWDMRTGKVLQSILNEPTKSPISHIAVSKQRGSAEGINLAETEEPESRWLAANSYDNVIRVYDRGFEPPTSIPRLMHSLKGYKNKHWPIKSTFFHGKDYIAGASARRPGKVRGGDDDESTTMAPTSVDKDTPLESSLILASGSMDPYVYLFDVSAGDGQYDLIQKLSGHTDRVYDVDFHPTEHVLASGSADFSVKVWGRASKRKK
ncbi:hypothetical protein BGW38_003105 [Lunasporangiospora selenospora]|uniref:WD40 repeat-like protein n=1 Tax=Lunasporangiospora selenospora TaxID=979761 RepID=A0A9P6KH26_9FUNG|nr:hypothetical protein BGW38_003105 [Lunasporangiospora selenospora]